ncbi:MAG: hypothetical protein LBJ46_04880 [Planctomycetota bacterium]|nr:hypothetical protein [Planctomycetota bacterium]
MPVLLKFLTGVHAGSEASLPSGDYVVGADAAADVILAEVAVKPRHAMMHIDGDRWEIEPLAEGAEVRVDGARIEGKTLVSPYQVVSLGGTHIALGPDGPWERLPGIPPFIPERRRAAADGDSSPARPEGEAQVGMDNAVPGEDGGNDSDRTDPVPAPGKKDVPDRRGGRKWLLPALFSMVAAGLAAWYCILTPNPNERLVDQVRDRLASAGFSVTRDDGDANLPEVIEVEPIGSGRVRLSGLLTAEEERRQAIEAAELPGAMVEDGLRTMEREVESLADALQKVNPHIRVSPLGDGFAVLLAGVADTEREADEAYRLSRARLDRRIGIRRRLWRWRELAQEAGREARRLGIAGARFVKDGGEMALMADSPVSAEKRRELAAAIYERLGNEAALFLTPAFDKPAKTENPPEPFRTGDQPPIPPASAPEGEGEKARPSPMIAPLADFWLVADLLNDGFRDQQGRVWRVGDFLNDEFLLVDVWRDGVVFQRGDDTLFIQRDAVLFGSGGEVGSIIP